MDELTAYDMIRHRRDIDKHITTCELSEIEMINRFRRTFQEDDHELQDTK